MLLKGESYMNRKRFLEAVEDGDTDTVGSMIADGADVNITDEHDRTAVYKAAKHGQLETLKLLKQHGAELDTTDNRGTNALYWAAIKGHQEVAEFLLENGASAHITDDRGWSLLDHVKSMDNKDMQRIIESALAQNSSATGS
jgi:ankyrin repeat protein